MAKFLTKLFKIQSPVSFFKKTLLFRDASSLLQNSILSGRWALDYDYDGTVQGRKVYWANMDNCGCCNESENLRINVKKKDETEDDEYILPYII